MKTLKDLFIDELQDRYDSEKQLLVAMPKMIEAATNQQLKKLIQGHLKQTEQHVTKLDLVFKSFDEKTVAKKCQATVWLIKEGEEILESFKGSKAINAAIIAAAQKIEHYEIASYGCLHEWSLVLENDHAAQVLQGILDQENEANEALIELAVSKCNNEASDRGDMKEILFDSRDGAKLTRPAL